MRNKEGQFLPYQQVMQADFDKLKKLAEDKRDGKVSDEEYSRRFYDAWSKTKKNRKVER